MKTLSTIKHSLSNGSKVDFLITDIPDLLYIEDDAGEPAVIDYEFDAGETLIKGMYFKVLLEPLKNAHTLTIFGYLVNFMTSKLTTEISFYYNGASWTGMANSNGSEVIPDYELASAGDTLKRTETGLEFSV